MFLLLQAHRRVTKDSENGGALADEESFLYPSIPGLVSTRTGKLRAPATPKPLKSKVARLVAKLALSSALWRLGKASSLMENIYPSSISTKTVSCSLFWMAIQAALDLALLCLGMMSNNTSYSRCHPLRLQVKSINIILIIFHYYGSLILNFLLEYCIGFY
jgi:hypothetical protein